MEQRVPSARSSRSSAGPAILRLNEPCMGGTRAVQARAQSRHEGSPHPEGSLASHLRPCPRLRPKGCTFALRAEPPPAGKPKEPRHEPEPPQGKSTPLDRKSTRLNSSHRCSSYAVFCLKKNTLSSSSVRGAEAT